MSYEMDPAEQVRTEERARVDALAGKFDEPFAIICGSAADKERKAQYNRVYAAAHLLAMEQPTAEPVLSDDLARQYEDLFGKRPHHRMKPETIQAAIDEAK